MADRLGVISQVLPVQLGLASCLGASVVLGVGRVVCVATPIDRSECVKRGVGVYGVCGVIATRCMWSEAVPRTLSRRRWSPLCWVWVSVCGGQAQLFTAVPRVRLRVAIVWRAEGLDSVWRSACV